METQAVSIEIAINRAREYGMSLIIVTKIERETEKALLVFGTFFSGKSFGMTECMISAWLPKSQTVTETIDGDDYAFIPAWLNRKIITESMKRS